MNEIEKLIQELCPDGVEYRRLGEVADCYSGATPKTSIATYWENGTIPWMNSGEVNLGRVYKTENKITKAGYDSCSTKMVPSHTVVIALAGQGKTRGTVAITEIELCTNQSLCAIKVQNEFVNSYYLYHYLRGQYLTLRKISSGDGTRGGLNQNMIRNFEIPLPPITIQEKIVEILDKFTSLEAELEAELEARRKQYKYYREKLLTFSPDDENVRWATLGEICELGTGSSNTNEELEDGKYPFFVRSQNVRYKNSYEYDETAIITSGDGVGVGKIFHYIEGKYALHQRAYRIKILDKNTIPKFVFYYMKSTFYNYIINTAFSSSVTSIRRPMLIKFPIPLPPLSEQRRIVEILDRFEALTNDLQAGLPAEIAARRQQYEYYREKLLTFKRKTV